MGREFAKCLNSTQPDPEKSKPLTELEGGQAQSGDVNSTKFPIGKRGETPIGKEDFEFRMRERRYTDAEALTIEGKQGEQGVEKEDWQKSIDLSGIEDADLRKKKLDTLAKYAKMWNGRLRQL